MIRKGVALHYNGRIPSVIAKAQGELLDILVKIALKNNIVIYRDTNIAEVLFSLDIKSQIPDELFISVAEIFAHCYRVNENIRKKIVSSVQDYDKDA